MDDFIMDFEPPMFNRLSNIQEMKIHHKNEIQMIHLSYYFISSNPVDLPNKILEILKSL